jgi:hypothetical protein
LHIEFREDMVRRPHMNAKGRCVVDVRIHASQARVRGGFLLRGQ